MVAFAVYDDLEETWRPLNDVERVRATRLLTYASRKIRRAVPDIDARIAAGTVDELDAQMVAVAMVKRAMSLPELDGVTQATDTVGSVSQSRSYGNPNGNLYITADELKTLGVGARRVGSIKLVSTDEPYRPIWSLQSVGQWWPR